MIDYNIDTIPQFQYIVVKSGEKVEFKGWMSIRMKPGEYQVICLVQYEAIFKQYIFTKKLCTYKGKCRPVTKYKGYGIIISAFQSREFRFGYPLIVPCLQTINEYHNLHPKYVDTNAATNILRHNNNKLITMGRNPLCQEVEYGASAKQYCNYEQKVRQL